MKYKWDIMNDDDKFAAVAEEMSLVTYNGTTKDDFIEIMKFLHGQHQAVQTENEVLRRLDVDREASIEAFKTDNAALRAKLAETEKAIPTVEQVAWVFDRITINGEDAGSFRHLIYDVMGFTPEAYQQLYNAGGMTITNAFADAEELVITKKAFKLACEVVADEVPECLWKEEQVKYRNECGGVDCDLCPRRPVVNCTKEFYLQQARAELEKENVGA